MARVTVCDICGKKMVGSKVSGEFIYLYPEDYIGNAHFDLCDDCATCIFDTLREMKEIAKISNDICNKKEAQNENNP